MIPAGCNLDRIQRVQRVPGQSTPTMWAIPLICSFLALHSVSSAAGRLLLTDLPKELLDIIVRKVVGSQNFDFCGYVDWLAGNRWAWPYTDIGMPMLKKVAEEENGLDVEIYSERVRRQQILKSVRTFVRIRSSLPIDCTGMDAAELSHLAGVFDSSYKECAFLSESSTWETACVAGLFGRNTLSTLLKYLSDDLYSYSDILLETALFIGDIDSLTAIIRHVSTPSEEVLDNVSEFDIVFSGSGSFFDRLFEFLPKVMEKRLDLIEEASRLNRLAILTRILKVAKPAEPHELNRILGSFSRLKMFRDAPSIHGYSKDELGYILIVAAGHGHLPIIRFLWPVMETMLNSARTETIIAHMMTEAGWSNHPSIIKFLLFQSGTSCMPMAHKYVNSAFVAAAGGGHVKLMDIFMGNDNAGSPVAPELSLTRLDYPTLFRASGIDVQWNGIKYLIHLKDSGDPRFADFELVDQENTALCAACEAGNYCMVEYLLCITDDEKFLLPRTNPAAQNNLPLVKACCGGNLQIVEKLLERDISGNYIYKGIDPSAQNNEPLIHACRYGHLPIVQKLLERDASGNYVHNGIDLSAQSYKCAFVAGLYGQLNVLKFLLEIKDGRYVFPEMKGANLTFNFQRNVVELANVAEQGRESF